MSYLTNKSICLYRHRHTKRATSALSYHLYSPSLFHFDCWLCSFAFCVIRFVRPFVCLFCVLYFWSFFYRNIRVFVMLLKIHAKIGVFIIIIVPFLCVCVGGSQWLCFIINDWKCVSLYCWWLRCVCASVYQVHTQIWRTFNSLMIFMANDSYLLPKRFSAAFLLSFHFISFHSVFLLI